MCEDCKWARDTVDGWRCLFRAVVPKAAEINYFEVDAKDESECPTWEREAGKGVGHA